MKKLIPCLSLLFLLLFVNAALAEKLNCESEYGKCSLSERSLECSCAGGDSISSGSVSSSTSIDSEDLEVSMENCLLMLEENCRSVTPLDSCDSEYGACAIYEDYNSCECADGSGSGGGESEPGSSGEGSEGGSDSDSEIPPQSAKIVPLDSKTAACEEILLAECPNLPPDPSEECSSEELSICNDMAQFTADCWGDKIWPYQIIECCNDYKTSADAMNSMWECFQKSSCDKIAEDCFDDIREADVGFVDESKAAGNDDGEGGKVASAGDGDGACNQNASSAPLWLLLLTLALLTKRNTVMVK